jgi:hypothetical protein
MMNRCSTFLFAVPVLFIFGGALAHAADAAGNESRLIGAWQEGARGNATPGQTRLATKAGSLGAVSKFDADHTFVIYPPCGQKTNEMRKLGMDAVRGTWELTGAGELVSTVNANGRSLKIENGVSWDQDQMILTNRNGSVAGKFGRYTGTLPPSC